MKIEQVDLKAFGHFTNRRLTLGCGADFHILCGQNEAGKTTLWRAINGALFGIPERTQDSFLHEARNLRVGLALCARSGERLAVMRRKGRINTLIRYDTESGDELSGSIPEDRLRDWLGGLSQGLFLAMFSLDHEALVRGGEALAQGKGEAGESLFEAGAGLSSIRTLRTRLEREAESLFKPRASTSTIYRALSEYEETRKAAKDAAVRPAEWTTVRSAMEAANRNYAAVRDEQERLQKESRRLERLAAILPDVATLELAERRLAELVAVPVLAPSAPSERIAAVTKRNQAISNERTARQRWQQHQSELTAIEINGVVLCEAESIEAIHHATTAYRDARLQAAKAEAAIDQAQSAFDFLSKEIAGGEVPIDPRQWIPDPPRLARIRTLITEGATRKATQQANRQMLGEKKLEIEQLDAEIKRLGNDDDAGNLADYLDSIADQGDPEVLAQQFEDEANAAEARLDGEARALKMPAAAAVAKATLPLDGEVQSFKADDDELRCQARSTCEAIEKIGKDLAVLQCEIEGLKIHGDMPTRETVASERAKRNAIWLAIRRHFMPLAGESLLAALTFPATPPFPSTPPPTAERYENAVVSADAAADGLFADAARATLYAEFRVRDSQMQSALDLERARAAALGTERENLDRRWAELLAVHGLPALKISEAAQWIVKREAFLQKFAASEAKRREAQSRRRLSEEIRSRLAAISCFMKLPTAGASERTSETLARARGIAKRNAEQLTRRQVNKAGRAKAEAALHSAKAAELASRSQLDEWQQKWAEAMLAIRLAGDACEEEATARLQQFSDLAQAHAALERSASEQRKARTQIDDYESRLARTWQRVHCEATPVDGRTHDVLAALLYRELSSMRAQQNQQNTLTQQIADDQQALDEARQAAAEAAASIDGLLLQAACSTIEALELVEGKSAQRSALAMEVREIESRLVRSAGLPLAEALAQAAGQNPESIAQALAENAQENTQNAADVQQGHAIYLTTAQAFERMYGSAQAAEAQQKSAQTAARIAELGADYAASRIASAVLTQVIDAYQKRNQGPLIEKAAQRFAAITGGRYRGVVVDYDEEKQILKALRADGGRLSVEKLSTGRRDQLFLALRLAAIEGHLDSGEPLPVIVDDILIQFDDQAATATFKVLAELSQRTQVLFLTHHEHLLEVANASIRSGAFQAHLL